MRGKITKTLVKSLNFVNSFSIYDKISRHGKFYQRPKNQCIFMIVEKFSLPKIWCGKSILQQVSLWSFFLYFLFILFLCFLAWNNISRNNGNNNKNTNTQQHKKKIKEFLFFHSSLNCLVVGLLFYSGRKVIWMCVCMVIYAYFSKQKRRLVKE